jgi:alpha-tubulin suppressor-like RCC1 family protein
VVSRTTITGVVGDTVRVTARALFPNDSVAPGVRLRFVSSAPSVATVDSTGLVRFVGAGTTQITVVDVDGTSSNPIPLTSFTRALTSVDAGGDHGCGIVGPGRLYCWGLNNFGQLGVPGDSTCYPLGVDDEPLPCELSPKRAAPTLTFSSVSAGEEFSCGVAAGGAGYCWGLDTLGQLGGGRPRGRDAVPTPSPITGSVRFAGIDAGQRHACGIELGASRAFCWGYDSLGQLGDATIFFGGVTSTTPIPVITADQTPLPLTQVTAGGAHSCGVAPGGAAWCWGDNSLGQLGTNEPGGPTTFPRPVAGGLTFTSVSAGTSHSCGLTTANQAYCWGSDGAGRLGRGVGSGSVPTPVAVAGGLAFTQLSAGFAHTCAVTAAGAAYCWGSNAFGQSGRIDAAPRPDANPVPIPVGGGHIFASVSAGRFHSCGVVTQPAADAGVWCWGGNLYGALGNQLQAAARGLPVRAVPLQ